jgi:hypothetical protein
LQGFLFCAVGLQQRAKKNPVGHLFAEILKTSMIFQCGGIQTTEKLYLCPTFCRLLSCMCLCVLQISENQLFSSES